MTSEFANETTSTEQKEIDKNETTKEPQSNTQAFKTEKTGFTCCGFCDTKAP